MSGSLSSARLQRSVRPAPFSSPQEHDEVGRALLDGQELCRSRSSLTTIAVWRRRLSSLPHAVESTASLLTSHDAVTTDTLQLRLSLSCAVLRTINGLADKQQQQRAVAGSVARLCAAIGLPSWLVDVRHEATHNDLPSLPVLRLAADALRKYLGAVYWEPMEQRRREDYDMAWAWLEQADKLEIEQKCKEQEVIVSSDSDGDDDDDNDDNDDDDDNNSGDNVLPTAARSLHPAPGTNTNRFALLLEENQKSTSRKRSKIELSPSNGNNGNISYKKKSRKTRGNIDRSHTPSSCVRHLVKAKRIPLDVKYEAALNFFLNAEHGALLFVAPSQLLEPRKDCKDVSTIVLSCLGRAWPGFLHALLIRCVDCVLQHPDTHKVKIVVSWVRYLLSSAFLGSLMSKSSVTRTLPHNDATSSSLLSNFQFPLNSLCDRCQTALLPNKEMVDFFTDMLGTERCPHHGLNQSMVELSTSTTVPHSGSSHFALEDMEAFLHNTVSTPSTLLRMASNDLASCNNQARSTWVRCTSWDPCAIGTLPGHGMQE